MAERRGYDRPRGRGVDKRRGRSDEEKPSRSGERPKQEHNSSNRGRGRGRGGGQGGRDKTSYGLFLWTQKEDGQWFFLAQISFSSYDLDYKIDPLRGRLDPTKDDSREHAAVREVYEETSRLVDFLGVRDQLVNFVGGKDSLYFHVRVHFESLEDEENFQQLFDQNRYERADALEPDEKETDGLVWCPQNFQAHLNGLRFASELTKLKASFSRFDEEFFDSLPSFVLERREVDGFNMFVARVREEGTGREHAEGITSVLPTWVGEVVANPLHERVLEAARKKIALYPEDTPGVWRKLAAASGRDERAIRDLLERRNDAPVNVDDLISGVGSLDISSSSSSSSNQ